MQRHFGIQRDIRVVLAVLVLAALLPACASKKIYLNDSERAALRKQPAIHVVHYLTPTPEVKPPSVRRHYVTVKLHEVPTGADIESNVKVDLTLEMTNALTQALAKEAGLSNLRVAREVTPLPVVKDGSSHKDKFKTGSVLEVWVDRYAYSYTPVDWQTYTILVRGRARLTRLDDGKTLWNTGECTWGGSGNNTYGDRLVLGELKTSESKKVQAKIKQTLNAVAQQCARQLVQDFNRNDKQ